jgi:hypothetical protein
VGRRLVGPQSRSGPHGKENYLLPLPRIERWFLVRPASYCNDRTIAVPSTSIHGHQALRTCVRFVAVKDVQCKYAFISLLSARVQLVSRFHPQTWSLSLGGVEGKVVTVQAMETLGVARGWGSHIFRYSAHRWQQVCQAYTPDALYPQEESLYSFLLESESTPGP